jgi:DNA-directed RNA polymerase subunit RPC12/RpoP
MTSHSYSKIPDIRRKQYEQDMHTHDPEPVEPRNHKDPDFQTQWIEHQKWRSRLGARVMRVNRYQESPEFETDFNGKTPHEIKTPLPEIKCPDCSKMFTPTHAQNIYCPDCGTPAARTKRSKNNKR